METTGESRQASYRSIVKVDTGTSVVFIGLWAWLFTIGYLHLTFWTGVLAIVLWPVYLGSAFASPHPGP